MGTQKKSSHQKVWMACIQGSSSSLKGKTGLLHEGGKRKATQEEQFADEKERKARTLLLMAVPKDHLRRFHGMDDAKEIWAAIKTRFGGNANSKKMQKAVLKQQFEAFTISSKESLEKGYDRFQKLLSQLDALGAGVSDEDANHKFLRSLPPAWDSLAMTMRTKKNIDTLSIDDLYNNLSVFEQDIQKTSSSSLTSDNVAFLSQAKASSSKHKPSQSSGSYSSYATSSSKATKTATPGLADEVIHSFLATNADDVDLIHEDLDQIDDLDLEEMDINWQIAMTAIKIKKFYKKTGRRPRVDGKMHVAFDKRKVECFNCHNTGHFARECKFKGSKEGSRQEAGRGQDFKPLRTEKEALMTIDEGQINWVEQTEDEELNHALMAFTVNNEVSMCSKLCLDSYNALQAKYDELQSEFGDQEAALIAHKLAVKKLESQLKASHKQQSSLNEKLNFQANQIFEKDEKLKKYRRIGMKAVKDKDALQKIVDSWFASSKNLWKLIDCGMSSTVKLGLGHSIKSNAEVLGYEEEMSRGIFVLRETDAGYYDIPLYSRFKQVEYKGVPHPLSGDYTPREQEIPLDDSLYEYGKYGPQPQSPSPTVSDASSTVYSTCQSNDSDGELGVVSDHSVNDDPINDHIPIPSIEQSLDLRTVILLSRRDGKGKLLLRGKRVVHADVRQATPAWTNTNRVNKANQFTPRPVQLSNIRPNLSTASNTIKLSGASRFNTGKQNVNSGRVNTAYKSNEYAVKGKMGTAVKTSAGCVWRKAIPLSNTNSGPTPDSNVHDHPLKHMEHRGIFDSGCSGHMTGNRAHLEDYQELSKVGSVTFGGSKGSISGKGTIRLGNLVFDDVAFVKELGHFNLFSISQICDKKLNVLFTEKECFVVSSDFKMPDENQVLLKVPRQHNMYTFDMKNVASSKGYTCLLAKASSNEAKLWHRRKAAVSERLAKKEKLTPLKQPIFNTNIQSVMEHYAFERVDALALKHLGPEVTPGQYEAFSPVLIMEKRNKNDIMLVQVYVDDIIFGSTNKSWCDEFEVLMQSRFQMSSMGELTFFLGLQVKQKHREDLHIQDKYVAEILKKFALENVKAAITPMETKLPLTKDEEAFDVDVHLYRSMIGNSKTFTQCCLEDLQVFKGNQTLGLWYPMESPLNLDAFSDSDMVVPNLDKLSTKGGCQFLGHDLSHGNVETDYCSHHQTNKEAEYVAAAIAVDKCCGFINQLLELWFQLLNTKNPH
ncbi:ribonuclease H-like domain-containing protein [Tanacetum coccineum]|uniref:Ribonuclease H-like domain-containing protein n=1 Tax=Tanacetum coccineum TaxID=301880 RepID=A0ABQ5D3J0_9ASTR